MLVIMISGRAGSGKTIFGQYCIEYLESLKRKSIFVPFAKGVKRTAKNCFEWDGNKDKAGRKLLQDIGLIGRKYNENLWANQATKTIDQVWVTGNEIVFIDDWRFPNEGKIISDKYTYVVKIRINRPVEYLALYGTSLYDDLSEISLPNEGCYDEIIINDDDLEKLQELAIKFVDKILKEDKNV